MERSRLIGMVLIGLGFVMAIGTGLFLAVGVQEMQSSDLLLFSLLAFVLIAPVVGGGIYFYVHEDTSDDGESLVLKQRELMDLLRAEGAVDVHHAARELGIDVGTLRELVHQLAVLQIFSGYWQDDMLYTAPADKLHQLTTCVYCGNPIMLIAGVNDCKHCDTEYFVP